MISKTPDAILKKFKGLGLSLPNGDAHKNANINDKTVRVPQNENMSNFRVGIPKYANTKINNPVSKILMMFIVFWYLFEDIINILL